VKPDYLDAYSLRGVVVTNRNVGTPPLPILITCFRSAPTDAQALLGRGVLALKRRDLETAEKDCDCT